MKCMWRNKRLFYYANFVRRDPVVDEAGNLTGDYAPVYGKPLLAYANVSPADGSATTKVFGKSADYDRVIVFGDPKFPVSETTILWIDNKPNIDTDGSTNTPHDYVVTGVSTSRNSKSIAVSKVTVRG